jgi:hypothetical protein
MIFGYQGSFSGHFRGDHYGQNMGVRGRWKFSKCEVELVGKQRGGIFRVLITPGNYGLYL